MKIGDKVQIRTLFDANNKPVVGIIVAGYYDDSDCLAHPTKYWMIKTSNGKLYDCLDDEIETVAN